MRKGISSPASLTLHGCAAAAQRAIKYLFDRYLIDTQRDVLVGTAGTAGIVGAIESMDSIRSIDVIGCERQPAVVWFVAHATAPLTTSVVLVDGTGCDRAEQLSSVTTGRAMFLWGRAISCVQPLSIAYST